MFSVDFHSYVTMNHRPNSHIQQKQVLATPGRLLDLMERKTVSLATIQNVVMDEADEMLNMGFTYDHLKRDYVL